MSKLSAFFGRTRLSSGTEHSSGLASTTSQSPIDEAGLATMGSRIGAENEGLRGLLIEASRKIEELDMLKVTFGNIVGPVGDMLRELEQEKSQNASLRNLLAEVRSNLDALRIEHAQTEKQRASLDQDNAVLRQDLAATQEDVQSLEAIRGELSTDVAAQRAQISHLERQLNSESSQRQSLADSHRLLGEQMQASDKKNVRLEADIESLREKLLLSDEEKQSLQKSLDQSIAEVSRTARRLSETESLLAAARSKIAELDTVIAENEAERSNLQVRLDEANERHQTEVSALSNRLGSLQSRASTSEKLLAEVRQNLVTRTEDIREWERKAGDSEAARAAADKKLRQVEAANDGLERQVAELTQSRATLVERSGTMTKTLKLREAALARAEEKVATLTVRVKELEGDQQALRETDEKRFEELNSALGRERMARAVAEGALASSRRDFARVQQEIATINTQRVTTTSQPPQTPAALAKRVRSFSKGGRPATEAAPKAKNGKKPSADDQIVKN